MGAPAAARVAVAFAAKAVAAFALLAVGGVILIPAGCLHDNGDDEDVGPPATAGPFEVVGYLLARPAASSDDPDVVGRRRARVFVPGVDAWIRNVETGRESEHVRTDLSGRFVIPPSDPGDYEVCWRAQGFRDGCEHPFTISQQHIYLGRILMTLENMAGTKNFFGEVRFADGTLTRFFEPLANVNAFARVMAHDPSGRELAPAAYVNNSGDYILAGVPVASPLTLRSSIEKGANAASIDPALLSEAPSQRVDLTIANYPPKFEGVIGDLPGGRQWTTAPGAVVAIDAAAKDQDNDPLRYRWILPDGSSRLTGSAASVDHKLPNYRGDFKFTSVAFDGRGGYTEDSIVISTRGVRFQGHVDATNRPSVQGAEVEVNGESAMTNAEGYVTLVVPEARRYVVNIRKSGYGLLSQIYDRGLLDARWTLTRASRSSVDPTQDIDVTNVRRPGDCPGSLSERRYTEEGEVVRKRCGPGIRVRIPAASLVDENGNAPSGNVEVQLTTVDLDAPDAMPGDFTAIAAGGNVGYMESWGAGTVAVRNGSIDFDLAEGAEAEVIIPIDPDQLASGAPIPSSIPFLSYDEKRGVWVEEGQATRLGNSYRATTTHLSAFNVDLQKTDQACARIESIVMPPRFELEFTVGPATEGAADIVRKVPIDNAQSRYHVLYNLPPDRPLRLRALDLSGRAIRLVDAADPARADAPDITLAYVDANTGPPQDPPTPNNPPFPYEACKGVSAAAPTERIVGLVARNLPPPKDNFLNGRLRFRAANLTELDAGEAADRDLATAFRDAAAEYYKTIDPFGFREDLAEFRGKNGFTGTPAADEIEATYANTADLGFGREMHCRRTPVAGLAGFDVACYVTNYGDQNTSDRQDLTDALARDGEIATVGMEYSRLEVPRSQGGDGTTFVKDASGNEIRAMKFYVFFKGEESRAQPIPDPEGNGRVISADLDGFGQRPVPQLCMVCHGGRYPGGRSTGAPTWNADDPASANLGSSFLPFDLTSFTLTDATGLSHKEQQQQAFKNLNLKMVLATEPPNEIREVIDQMYGGANHPNEQQSEDFVVDGWSGQEDLYRTIVAPTCRGCHITLGPSVATWSKFSEFDAFKGLSTVFICDQHVMPHALMTHRRFWLSVNPYRPQQFDSFVGGGTNCKVP